MGHGKESDLTERAEVFLDADHEGGTTPSVPLSGGFFAEIVTEHLGATDELFTLNSAGSSSGCDAHWHCVTPI